MTTEILTISAKELDRAELMRRVHEPRLSQRKAAEILEVTERQIQRLYKAYRTSGPAGLISAKRGRASNRRAPIELRNRAMQLVRSRYADFGPTLAQEKLSELEGLSVSVETLRKWMIAEGPWTPHKQRDKREGERGGTVPGGNGSRGGNGANGGTEVGNGERCQPKGNGAGGNGANQLRKNAVRIFFVQPTRAAVGNGANQLRKNAVRIFFVQPTRAAVDK